MLNKQKGNMYGFVTHTLNYIKGKCEHNCDYCYMKVFPQAELRLDEKELNTDLGMGKIIFVGSSTDMFAENVPSAWIIRVLQKCREYNYNKYLFQSKNPKRMIKFLDDFPENTILATTIETNRPGFNYNAPPVEERKLYIQQDKFPVMITIEPVIDFDLTILFSWLRDIRPKYVAIGADSKGHNLPEPSQEKIDALIKELGNLTEVKIKPNLKRLVEEKR